MTSNDIAVTVLAFLGGVSHAVSLEWFEGYPTMLTGNSIATSMALWRKRWIDAAYRASLILGYVIGSACARYAELSWKRNHDVAMTGSSSAGEDTHHHHLGIIAPFVLLTFVVADIFGIRHAHRKIEEDAKIASINTSTILQSSIRQWQSQTRTHRGGLPEKDSLLASIVTPPAFAFGSVDDIVDPPTPAESLFPLLFGKKWHSILLAAGYGMIYSSTNRAFGVNLHILTGNWTKLGETISDGLLTGVWWNNAVFATVLIILSVVFGVAVGMQLLQSIDERFPFFTLIGVIYATVLIAI